MSLYSYTGPAYRAIERPADVRVLNAPVNETPCVVDFPLLGKFQAEICHLKYLGRAKAMPGHGSDVSNLEPLRTGFLQGLAFLPQRVFSWWRARCWISEGGRDVLAWDKLNGLWWLCHLRRKCVAVLPNQRSSGRAEAGGRVIRICARPQGAGGPARAYRYRLALRRPYRYR